MQRARRLLFGLMLLAALLPATAARAQCLPLASLCAGIVAGRITPDSLQALLPPAEWAAHPGDTPQWTHRAPGQAADAERADKDADKAADKAAADEDAEAWVGLRRSNNQGYYDLVYKTTRRECIARVRAELRRRGKLTAEIVNCVQCAAERLTGDGFTLTLFDQKASYAAHRTPYPYVLVLRRTAGAAPAAAPDAPPDLVGGH